jgi:hypothetical protein
MPAVFSSHHFEADAQVAADFGDNGLQLVAAPDDRLVRRYDLVAEAGQLHLKLLDRDGTWRMPFNARTKRLSPSRKLAANWGTGNLRIRM